MALFLQKRKGVIYFRINAVPRPIPEKKWFMEPGVIILLGGILPFASIFIEMYVFKRYFFVLFTI